MDKFASFDHFYYNILFSFYEEKHIYKLLIVVCALTVIFYYLNFKRKRQRLIKIMQMYNGPPTIPIFGNALQLLGPPKEVLRKCIEMLKHYKNPATFWLMHKPYIAIFSPEDFQIVAHKTLEKDSSYRFAVDMLGDGIFTSEVKKWKRHRRIINPTLNPAILIDYFLPIFNKQNLNLNEGLKKEVGTGKQFDLWPYVSKTSISTICETAMGYEDLEASILMEFGHAIVKSAELVSKRFYKPWLMPSSIFTIYKYLLGYGKIFNIVQDLPLKMLKIRRKKFEDMKSNYHKYSDEDKRMRNFIDMLLNVREMDVNFTDQEVADEVISIMFGGSETNAVTNCFLLMMLAMKPNIQEKVYQEIHQIFGDSDRLPDFEDLKKLEFLEQCIKETLRRFPVVPIILRHTKYDIPISNGNLIPAGANIILGIYAIHHNPTIYPNPEDWNPSNFDPDKVALRHQCSFVPFSTGPRGCVGQKYAMVSMKAQLSTILRNYKVSTDFTMDDIELNVDMIIRNLHGYHVKLDYRYGKSIF